MYWTSIYWNILTPSPVNGNRPVPWSSGNLVMPLIGVAHGYSNNNFLFRGVIGYPCTCMSPFWNCRTSLGTVGKLWLLNNIASIVRVAIKYLLELSPQNGVRPWAQIMGSWGTCSHPPKLTPKRKTAKTTLRYREIHDSYIKAGIHPEFFQSECWLQLNPGVSANLDYSQPITAISSEELCENIFKKNHKC